MKNQNKDTILLKIFFVITLLTLTYLSSCANFLNEKLYENSDSDGTSGEASSSGNETSGENNGSGTDSYQSDSKSDSFEGGVDSEYFFYSFFAYADVNYTVTWANSKKGTLYVVVYDESKTPSNAYFSGGESGQTFKQTTNGNVIVYLTNYNYSRTSSIKSDFTITVSNTNGKIVNLTLTSHSIGEKVQ
ncbi:hypothetical protein [uncultured Treponema sp.]|uniref:hypothetical protein n=1 Tax=uncultured Treponema sp. TaxID=162155 RepID=UPI0025EF8585|nr:hypothetical protein [uncultured Treponema sp.]